MARAPLLSKYLEAFEKDPTSKVFAPLAESYRRLGMLKDAKNILNKGFQYHPKYVPGLITLAHCFYDEGQFIGAYDTLKPIVRDQYENYTLQRLFAYTCYQLGKRDEALETFKFLLFINPKDVEAAGKVSELEKLMNPLQNPKKVKRQKVKREPRHVEIDKNILEKKISTEEDLTEDQWTQVDFSKPEDVQQIADEGNVEIEEVVITQNYPEHIGEDDVIVEDLEVVSSEDDSNEVSDDFFESNEPVITHTLVDLYLGQKLYAKAQDVLEKILELTPGDEASKLKLQEVKKLIADSEVDTSRKSLMDVYDEKIANFKDVLDESPELKLVDDEEIEQEIVETKTGLNIDVLESVYTKYLDVLKAKISSKNA